MCLPVAKTHLPTSIFRHLGYLIRIPKLPIFFRLEDFWTYSLKRREKLSQCEIDTHGTFFQFLMSKGEVFFIGTKRCKNLLRWLCCRQKKITFFFEDFVFEKNDFFQGEGGIVGDMLNMYGWTVGKNRQLSLRLDAQWPILTHCDWRKNDETNRLIHDKICGPYWAWAWHP